MGLNATGRTKELHVVHELLLVAVLTAILHKLGDLLLGVFELVLGDFFGGSLVDSDLALECLQPSLAQVGIKVDLLDARLDRALEILCSMPREEYLSLLVRLLKAAGGKGDEKIALSAKDRDEIGETLVERANKELNAHYTLAGEAADIRAGLVLISKECDVNCSFEMLLALSREKTERGAAKLLFAE